VALGQVTVLKRTRGMVRQIARLEWRCRPPSGDPPRRVLVVYDSRTGNTEKIARVVAECLEADLARVDDGADAGGYDLVVIGTPVISSRPTDEVLRFVERSGGLRNYAAFVTYGAPLWGPISTRKAFDVLSRAAGAAPLASFACRGRHPLIHTYRHHPNEDDLLSAFLFGIRVARRAALADGHRRQPWTRCASASTSSG
jgi:hypothetical protein